MPNEPLRQPTSSELIDEAIRTARSRQRLFWLLSGLWIAATLVISVFYVNSYRRFAEIRGRIDETQKETDDLERSLRRSSARADALVAGLEERLASRIRENKEQMLILFTEVRRPRSYERFRAIVDRLDSSDSFSPADRDAALNYFETLASSGWANAPEDLNAILERLVDAFAAAGLDKAIDQLDSHGRDKLQQSQGTVFTLLLHYGDRVLGSPLPLTLLEDDRERLESYMKVGTHDDPLVGITRLFEMLVAFKAADQQKTEQIDDLLQSARQMTMEQRRILITMILRYADDESSGHVAAIGREFLALYATELDEVFDTTEAAALLYPGGRSVTVQESLAELHGGKLDQFLAFMSTGYYDAPGNPLLPIGGRILCSQLPRLWMVGIVVDRRLDLGEREITAKRVTQMREDSPLEIDVRVQRQINVCKTAFDHLGQGEGQEQSIESGKPVVPARKPGFVGVKVTLAGRLS